MWMIMLVLDDVSHLDDVLAAWSRVGAFGVTALEGLGIHRHRSVQGLVHARRNIENLGLETERINYTLFAVVADEASAQECLAATEPVIGDLSLSGTGLWAAWPVASVKGLPGRALGSGAL
jgi:hypothetical protein